jgi:hypothetical protein
MAAFRDRVLGLVCKSAASALEEDLRRATQAASVQVPEVPLQAIVLASHEEDGRRKIMQHLRTTLSESASAHWRRVYLGMLVLEELLQKGSKSLVAETASGMHFDLAQRLAFLEQFEFGFDQRVESLVRRKAEVVRRSWLQEQKVVDGGSWLQEQKVVDGGFSLETCLLQCDESTEAEDSSSDHLQDASTTDDESATSVDGSSGHDSWVPKPTAPPSQQSVTFDLLDLHASSTSTNCAPQPDLFGTTNVALTHTPGTPEPHIFGAAARSAVAQPCMGMVPATPVACEVISTPTGSAPEPKMFGAASPDVALPCMAMSLAPTSTLCAPEPKPFGAIASPVANAQVGTSEVAPATSADREGSAPAGPQVDWLKVAAAKGLLFDELASKGDKLLFPESRAAVGSQAPASSDALSSLLDL